MSADPDSDVVAVNYELNRLHEFLQEYEKMQLLQDRIIRLVDHAAWEQLVTALRGARSTIRNVEGQIRRLS